MPSTAQQIMRLRDKLIAAQEKRGLPNVAAVSVLVPKNFPDSSGQQCTSSPSNTGSLPDVLPISDVNLIPATQETVTSKPLPISEMGSSRYKSVDHFLENIKLTSSDRAHIEKQTVDQNKCIDWYHQRSGSITSTQINDINRYYHGAKISPGVLVKKCLKNKDITKVPKPSGAATLKWGRDNEDPAIKRYILAMSTSHKNLTVTKCGLFVHPDESYLRASPDGIASCECHGSRLIEVKCPHSARAKSVRQGILDEDIEYLTCVDGKITLINTTKLPYLSQVQAAMGICGYKQCDFIVYTMTDIVILPISFDPGFWGELFISGKRFFKEEIAPCLLGLKSYETPKNKADNSDLPSCDLPLSPTVIRAYCNLPAPGDTPEASATMPVAPSSKSVVSDNPPVIPMQVAPSSTSVVSDNPPVTPSTSNDGEIYKCVACLRILPEDDFISADNSDASIGCECKCGCTSWYCWSCAKYNPETYRKKKWFCMPCTSNCIKRKVKP